MSNTKIRDNSDGIKEVLSRISGTSPDLSTEVSIRNQENRNHQRVTVTNCRPGFTRGARGGACRNVETRLGDAALVVAREVACGATMMENVNVCGVYLK